MTVLLVDWLPLSRAQRMGSKRSAAGNCSPEDDDCAYDERLRIPIRHRSPARAPWLGSAAS